ncbi:amidohydrolase family protein [Variovorax saccharolyticus]|uniref:amidohydrolase family protein n=1 Tax=Variovorax saccharolyticus TaxID=3053516 RepID=UPI002575B58E|nr:amidohydrolase family protein [Variovorax sp. J22R187]MDM0022209.1 amidohydrolase family protein [Variovorax sp. J22R187]
MPSVIEAAEIEDHASSYRGSTPRNTNALNEWHERALGEVAVEPGFPIVDAHHHVFGAAGDPHYYQPTDLRRDISAGHNIIGTVCVEAYRWGWRQGGAEALKPVGEVEFLVDATAAPIQSRWGPCQVAAGIVSGADLTLGSGVSETLDAQLESGQGRLRGVRHNAAHDDGPVGRFIKHPAVPHLLLDGDFRKGFALLRRRDLSFDAWIFHHQIEELVDLAAAFPDTRIVLNHVGGVIGVGKFGKERASVISRWRADLRKLAARPNVFAKIGGMGMPMFGFGFEHREAPATSADLAPAWAPLIDECIEAFGPQRCMFESNFPVDRQSCGYTALWNVFKRATAALAPDERRDLFYRTACRAYRLPALEKAGDLASGS